MRPDFRAASRASVSTVLPRPALTNNEPCFIRSRNAAFTNFSVSDVKGSRLTTTSASGRSRGSSSADRASSRGCLATPMTCAPNGASRAATARPIEPSPTTNTVVPSRSSIGWCHPSPASAMSRFHSPRCCRSQNSSKRRRLARITATTHSETGASWTPTALHTTTPGGTFGSSQSTPALRDWITRSPGSSSKRPGSRFAMSKLRMTNSTSGPGSATSWTPSGSGSSSRLSGPSGTSTFKRLPTSGEVDRARAAGAGGWGQSRSPIGGFALFEREPQHFLDPPGKVECHLLADALGDVVQVLLVALREDDLLQSHPVGGQHLLLDTTDRQHQALQCDLAGHADCAPNWASREQAHDRRGHGHAGRRTVLGHSARGHVDVERLLDSVGLDPELSGV